MKSDSRMSQTAQDLFSRLFLLQEPYGFYPSFDLKALLYPTFFSLPRRIMRVIVKGLKAAGDDGFFVFVVPDLGTTKKFVHCRFIKATNWEEYYDSDYSQVLENALFSYSGSWAISISESGATVVGGTRSFIDLIQSHLPEFHDAHRKYVSDMLSLPKQVRPSKPTILELLSCIYGKQRAQEILEEFDVES